MAKANERRHKEKERSKRPKQRKRANGDTRRERAAEAAEPKIREGGASVGPDENPVLTIPPTGYADADRGKRGTVLSLPEDPGPSGSGPPRRRRSTAGGGRPHEQAFPGNKEAGTDRTNSDRPSVIHDR
jgi:hypothetical protein